jgi:hypothetical protein
MTSRDDSAKYLQTNPEPESHQSHIHSQYQTIEQTKIWISNPPSELLGNMPTSLLIQPPIYHQIASRTVGVIDKSTRPPPLPITSSMNDLVKLQRSGDIWRDPTGVHQPVIPHAAVEPGEDAMREMSQSIRILVRSPMTPKQCTVIVIRAYSLGKECIPHRILRLERRERRKKHWRYGAWCLPSYPSVSANQIAQN